MTDPVDPRIEPAARALYASVNKPHAERFGWDEVKPRWQESYRNDATAAIAAIDKAATITTAEQADELPGLVLIVTEQGGYWESIMRGDGKNWWQEPGTPGGGYVAASEDLTYPARVIHRATE